MTPTDPPSNMKALLIRQYCDPSGYEVGSIATPQITESNSSDILIRVRAAALNPGDIFVAKGLFKFVVKDSFPYIPGYDVSGVIVKVGEKAGGGWKVGDEVVACVQEKYRGTIAEYSLVHPSDLARKPPNTTFTEAASFPSCALTVYGALQQADTLLSSTGGLAGKTILITGGLSGTGSLAIQMAKNLFFCSKIITTLSTSKISEGLLEKHLPGIVDEILDYTATGKESVISILKSRGDVDVILENRSESLSLFPAVKKGGVLVSIAQVPPPGSSLHEKFPIPAYLRYPLDLANRLIEIYASVRFGVVYRHFLVHPSGETLGEVMRAVGEGKVKAVVGGTTRLCEGGEGLERMKAFAEMMFKGRGGVGKYVVEVE